jgi:hypothetical protein
VIIVGHARFAAAQKLGLAEVPVIVLRHLSDAQRRALVIADNRLALNAGWDEEMLRIELTALQEVDFNLDPAFRPARSLGPSMQGDPRAQPRDGGCVGRWVHRPAVA